MYRPNSFPCWIINILKHKRQIISKKNLLALYLRSNTVIISVRSSCSSSYVSIMIAESYLKLYLKLFCLSVFSRVTDSLFLSSICSFEDGFGLNISKMRFPVLLITPPYSKVLRHMKMFHICITKNKL